MITTEKGTALKKVSAATQGDIIVMFDCDLSYKLPEIKTKETLTYEKERV